MIIIDSPSGFSGHYLFTKVRWAVFESRNFIYLSIYLSISLLDQLLLRRCLDVLESCDVYITVRSSLSIPK